MTDSLIRTSVGICLCTWIDKIELQGPALAAEITPPDGCRIWRLARTRALLTAKSPAVEIVESWKASLPARSIYTMPMTAVYADFLLIGPRSRDVLSKLTSMNIGNRALPNGACSQASVAHAHCLVLRNDRGGLPAFHLLVARDYGQSVHEAILHAGEEFHMTTIDQSTVEAL